MTFPREIRDEDAVVHGSASEAFRMQEPLQRTMNGVPFTFCIREHTAFMYTLRNGQGTKGFGTAALSESVDATPSWWMRSPAVHTRPLSARSSRQASSHLKGSGRTARRAQRSAGSWATLAYVSNRVVARPSEEDRGRRAGLSAEMAAPSTSSFGRARSSTRGRTGRSRHRREYALMRM